MGALLSVSPDSQGNGIIVGLGICGVVFAATSSAATLMGDFRTGYMCLTAPRAMFVAQLVGQLIGAVLAPVAFMLFWGTGQVNVPNGPYPGKGGLRRLLGVYVCVCVPRQPHFAPA